MIVTRGKSCRNLISVLNELNHEHHSLKKEADLKFNFYDYKRILRARFLSENLPDMQNVGVKDDSLVLIEALNTNIAMAIDTPNEAT